MSNNGKPEFTSASFYQYLAEGKIMGSRCRTSGKLYVPPKPMCPETYSTDMEWEEVSGKGKLRAYTVITVGPTGMVEAGYNFRNPYCAGIVELEEGPSVSGQILNVDIAHPENIKIGTPMKATLVERGEGENRRSYLAFEPT